MFISVIVPTFNRWPLLRRALDSVLNQTRLPDEIIVIDDGSTDGTTQSVTHIYGDKIRLIKSENLGVSSARNIGVQKAKGNWIALLDSDDEWLKDKLAIQEQHLMANKNENIKLCHTEEIWIRNGKRVNPMKKHQKYGGQIFQHCLPLCAISPSSAMIHRSIFDTIGWFDVDLPACEDYDFWLRLTARHEVLFINQPLLNKYGGHLDQLSRKYWGMDRFRVQALRNLLASGQLDQNQTRLVMQTMAAKTSVLLKGAIKHQNDNLIKFCNDISPLIPTDMAASENPTIEQGTHLTADLQGPENNNGTAN